MPFWSTNFRDDPTLKDPKRNFRFTIEFDGIDSEQGGPLAWYAKTVTKPSFTVENVEHAYLNHKFYYPGAVTWNTVTIEMVDPLGPDVTATFADIIQQSGYAPPANSTALGSISKAKAAAALGQITITQIDSDGKPLETWTLWNGFLKDFQLGTLAYGDDELSVATLEIMYDWAKVETANSSEATNGSRGKNFFTQVSGE